MGFRRKLTALALCKSIESAIQWFQIHHRITFATIKNSAVYLSGARVSILSTLVPLLVCKNEIVTEMFPTWPKTCVKCQCLHVAQSHTSKHSP